MTIHATHAKSPSHATPCSESIPGHPNCRVTHDTPFNVGFKTPCQCNSGKKFKHCCFARPSIGWAWVLLSSKDYVPVALDLRDTGEFDAPAILLHPTYQEADTYVRESGIETTLKQKILIVRLAIEDLLVHIEKQFENTEKLYVIVPEGCTEDGKGAVYQVDPKVIGTSLVDDYISKHGGRIVTDADAELKVCHVTNEGAPDAAEG